MAWLAGETRRYRVALGAAVLASVVYLGWPVLPDELIRWLEQQKAATPTP
jgi:hypothetical protein